MTALFFGVLLCSSLIQTLFAPLGDKVLAAVTGPSSAVVAPNK